MTSPAAGVDAHTGSTWRDELEDLVRGISGGFLLGIPLLFTLELWQIGASATPPQLAMVLLVTLGAVALLIHTAGFRASADRRWSDVLFDTAEAVATGLVCVAAVLLLMREITSATPFAEGLGRIVYEATPFSLGVAVARHVLGRSRDADEDGEGDQRGNGRGAFVDLGASAIGALFVGLSIAPTEEVPKLTAALAPPSLLLLMATSLVVTYGIVYEAGFGDQAKRRQQEGLFQHPITETAVAYLVALAVAAMMLLFFGGLGDAPPAWAISQVIVLGLPAAVGGAAGRLAI